jgi:C-1 hydroxylase
MASDADANLMLVRRFYEELWNGRRLDVAGEIVAEAVRFRGTLGTVCDGRDEFKRYAEDTLAAFPDWHNRIDEIFAVGDRVIARMTWSGTHRGALAGIPPTGARVEYAGAAFFRLAGGLIEEAWVVGDTQELWRALGVAPPKDRPASPRST